jgi:signal peptidase II
MEPQAAGGPPDGGSKGPPRRPSGGLSVGWRRALIIAVAAVVVAVDQATKTWALHHASSPRHVIWTLQLAVTFNSGSAFGLWRGASPLIIAGAILLVVVLLGLGRAASRTANLPATIAMGLLLGGALGNLTDRLFRHHHGAVIDFVDLRWWPVFNVADACITIGALLLVLVGFRAAPSQPDRRRTDDS